MRKTKWSILLILMLCIFMSTSTLASSIATVTYSKESQTEGEMEMRDELEEDTQAPQEDTQALEELDSIQPSHEQKAAAAGIQQSSQVTVNTFAQLKNALSSSETTQVVISGDITMESTLTIGRNMTIKSAVGQVKLDIATGRHFIAAPAVSELTLDGIILDGSGTGGGINAQAGVFKLIGGTIQNCKAEAGGALSGTNLTVEDSLMQNNSGTNGGAVFSNQLVIMPETTLRDNKAIQGGGAFSTGDTMIGGVVEGNVATNGGGIFATNFKLEGGIIRNNSAIRGGGVWARDFTFFYDSLITGNTADYGGGVYVDNHVDMRGRPEERPTISNNTAKYQGGGLFIGASGDILTSTISGNKVLDGNGGGIYISDLSGLNIVATVFSDNSAPIGYEIKDEDKALHDSKISGTSFTEPYAYGYNNFDISYNGGTPTTQPVTVTYHANDGSDNTEEVKVPVGETIELAGSDIFDRSGYELIGWSLDAEEETVSYGLGEAYTVNGDVNFYAVWKQEAPSVPVLVQYDAQGGAPAPGPVIGYTGKTLVEPTPSPTLSDHTFVGWFTAATGGQKWNFDTDLVTDSMTLYAQYTSVSVPVIVQYDTQGGTPKVDPVLAFTGQKISQPATNPAKTGFVFDGWFTQTEGGSKWDFDNDIVRDNMTLYAQYKLDSHPVIVQFDVQGGTPTIGPIIAYTGLTIDQPNVQPQKDNLIFTGWFTQAEGGNQWDFENDIVRDSMTLYAQYKTEGNPVLVLFNAMGGSPEPGPVIGYTGETIAAPQPSPQKAGFTFTGWFTEPEGGVQWDFDNDIVSDTMTLYAQYEEKIITYYVIFESNGGSPVDPVLVSPGGLVPRPADPVKTNYNFAGWWTIDPNMGHLVQWDFDTPLYTDLYLEARWEEALITVTFDSRGGSYIPPYTGAIGVSLGDLKASGLAGPPVLEGNNFVGWEGEDGELWNESIAIEENITLYARWESAAVPATLTYNANGGTPNVTENVMTGAYTLKSAEKLGITRFRNVFFGWSSTSDGPIEYQPGDTITITGNTTVYAVWKSPYFGNSVELKTALEEPSFDTIYGYQSFTMTGVQAIERDVNIVSDSNSTWTITAAANQRHFVITDNDLTVNFDGKLIWKGASGRGGIENSGHDVILSGVNLQNNNASTGGAILSTGSLTLVGGNFANNSATNGGAVYAIGNLAVEGNATFNANSATYGGAIYATRNASLDVTDSVAFTNNTVVNFGGAIYTLAPLSNISGSVRFTGNKATSTTIGENGGWGGAVAAEGNNLTVSGNVTFSGNSAGYVAGALVMRHGTLTMKGDVKVDNNSSSYWGGGVSVRNSKFYMQDKVSITNNKATNYGGGMSTDERTEMYMSGTTVISGNQAINKNGGGISLDETQLTMSGSAKIQGNTAKGLGGGLYASNKWGDLIMQDSSEITGNKASDGGGVMADTNVTMSGYSRVYGNAATTSGGGIAAPAGTVSLSGNAKVNNNSSVSSGGGIVIQTGKINMSDSAEVNSNYTTGSGTHGGGIYILANGTLTMAGYSKVNSNTTKDMGGGIYSAATGGATINIGGNSDVYNNTAGRGGGVAVNKVGQVNVYDTANIRSNNASEGGGIFFSSTVTGGGINMYGSSKLGKNTASGHGGGMMVYTTKILIYLHDNAQIHDNRANGGNGGGVATYSRFNAWGNTKINMNYAKNAGGALSLGGSGVDHSLEGNVKIFSNDAYEGAGIYAGNSCRVMMSTTSQIYENGSTRTLHGGGVVLVDYASLAMYGNAEINRNYATSGGCGIISYNKGGLIALYDNSRVRNNYINGIFVANTASNRSPVGINIGRVYGHTMSDWVIN